MSATKEELQCAIDLQQRSGKLLLTCCINRYNDALIQYLSVHEEYSSLVPHSTEIGTVEFEIPQSLDIACFSFVSELFEDTQFQEAV